MSIELAISVTAWRAAITAVAARPAAALPVRLASSGDAGCVGDNAGGRRAALVIAGGSAAAECDLLVRPFLPFLPPAVTLSEGGLAAAAGWSAISA